MSHRRAGGRHSDQSGGEQGQRPGLVTRADHRDVRGGNEGPQRALREETVKPNHPRQPELLGERLDSAAERVLPDHIELEPATVCPRAVAARAATSFDP